jgi:hypothetical protein
MIPVMVLLAGLSMVVLSSRASAVPISARAVLVVNRNIALERSAFARKQSIGSFLQPATKARLDPVLRTLLFCLASGSENVDLYAFVQTELYSSFPRLSIEQSNLFTFYVLAETARLLTVPDELKGKLDGMNEMSEMTSLRLQMTMDRRSKFISTLSNIMKKIATTQDSLAQNIK